MGISNDRWLRCVNDESAAQRILVFGGSFVFCFGSEHLGRTIPATTQDDLEEIENLTRRWIDIDELRLLVQRLPRSRENGEPYTHAYIEVTGTEGIRSQTRMNVKRSRGFDRLRTLPLGIGCFVDVCVGRQTLKQEKKNGQGWPRAPEKNNAHRLEISIWGRERN